MKPLILLALTALTLPAFAGTVDGSFHEGPIQVADRTYPLLMQGHTFNGFTFPDTPLLEAFLGERVEFVIAIPPLAEAHTFHLHGHPWLVPDQNRVVDTFLLQPGDVHRFTITAGGVGEHPGDWMYHCHIDSHVHGGMWGIFRVYPFTLRLTPDADGYVAHVDRLGEPLTDVTFTATVHGEPVPLRAEPLADEGHYRLHTPPLPTGGELAVTAHHPLGESVARAETAAASDPSTHPLTATLPGTRH